MQQYQNSTAHPFLDRTGLAPRPNTAPHSKLTFAKGRPVKAADASARAQGVSSTSNAQNTRPGQALGVGTQAQAGRGAKPPMLQLHGITVNAEPKSARTSAYSTPCSSARSRGSARHGRAASIASQGSQDGPDLQRIGRSTISSRAKGPRMGPAVPDLRSRFGNASDACQADSNVCPHQPGATPAFTARAESQPQAFTASDLQNSQNSAQTAAMNSGAEAGQALPSSRVDGQTQGLQDKEGMGGEAAKAAASLGRPVEIGSQPAAGLVTQPPASEPTSGAQTSRSATIRKAGMTTTHRLTYGMADAYPELYQQAIEAGRAQPAPNLNFRSAWGESLSKAAAAAASQDQASGRSTLLSRGARQTTYANINDQVQLSHLRDKAHCQEGYNATKKSAADAWST